jgi:hypothetical protein
MSDLTYDDRIVHAERVVCTKCGKAYDRQAKTPAPTIYLCLACRGKDGK